MLIDRYGGCHSSSSQTAISAFEDAVLAVLAHRPMGEAIQRSLQHDDTLLAAQLGADIPQTDAAPLAPLSLREARVDDEMRALRMRQLRRRARSWQAAALGVAAADVALAAIIADRAVIGVSQNKYIAEASSSAAIVFRLTVDLDSKTFSFAPWRGACWGADACSVHGKLKSAVGSK